MLKLGVNIDHVATLRQARYRTMPDSPNAEPGVVAAALVSEAAGADSITIHLRADRRHAQDADVYALREKIVTKLNLEMGNTPEILAVALEVKPDFVCLVPENRLEVTTEGGLDAAGNVAELRPTVDRLRAAGIEVSLFIDPEPAQVEAAFILGAEMVELHTGAFANAMAGAERDAEVAKLAAGARRAHAAGLRVHAGHGITTANVRALDGVPYLVEFNIGHHLVSRAVFVGLGAAVSEMRAAMDGYPGPFPEP
ncbi:pyridoxine 5'-phosphate synthase [soil metagenome]